MPTASPSSPPTPAAPPDGQAPRRRGRPPNTSAPATGSAPAAAPVPPDPENTGTVENAEQPIAEGAEKPAATLPVEDESKAGGGEEAAAPPPVAAKATPSGDAPPASRRGRAAAAPAPAPATPPSQPTGEAAPVAGNVSADGDGLNIPGLCFTNAGDVLVSDLHFLILVYGDSGAGKTHFGSQADGAIVVLVEPQGFATIHAANPKAKIVGSVGDSGHPRCRNFGEVRAFFQAAAKGQLPSWVKTIVIDSLTELQQLMMDEIIAKKKEAMPAQPKPSDGSEVKKGPAPEMTKQDWGVLSVNLRNFMRMLRSLPYNIICLALPDSEVDEETGKRIIVPKLAGGMKTAIPAYFNIVGYIYKQMTSAGMQRAIMLDSDAKYLTKSYGGLTGIVQADIHLWFRVLAQKEEGTAASSLRPPGAMSGSRRSINSTPAAGAAPATTATEETGNDY